jgi:serine phosphatase RsbU (regulator of sigma subunit)
VNKKIILLFLAVSISLSALSNLDSLAIKLKKAKNDSSRIELYYKASLSKKYSLKTADSLLDKLNNFKKSSICFIRFLSHYRIGCHYIDKEQSSKALANLLHSLKIADSCSLPEGHMMAHARLAYVNKIALNFKSAILNSHISLKYARQLNDSDYLATNYTLLGNMYKTNMLLDSALDYHLKALAIREIKKDQGQLANTYNNLGLVYKNKNELKKALDYLRKSMDIKLKIKDKTLSASYNNMSIVFRKGGMFDSSIFYSQKSVTEGVKYKKLSVLGEALMTIASTYDTINDYKMALHYYKRLKIVEDSVKRDDIDLAFQELQSKYESDKKDGDLKLQSESLKTAEAINSKKNILIVLSSLALLMALIAAIFIYRSYKQSKKNAVQLGFKNKVIEEKNKEITDSINYAKNIQQSLITSDKVFADNLKDHFILYLPKDIVAGDFYWAHKVGKEFIIVCADCTGHGVPGAFMSLMGIGYLKEVIIQKGITRPDLVFNEMRDRIIEGFGTNENKDGMDATLIKINGLELEVAAANNSIWIIRNNENIVVKPDKFPIGMYLGEKKPFTLNKVELKPNDIVLMYTDGYGDQFGGPQNKKFKHKTMEKLLIENQGLSMEEMKKLLYNTLIEWKGVYDQVDDILVIGFRV